MEVKDLRSKIIATVNQEKTNESILLKKAYALSAYFLMKEIKISDDDILAGNIEGMDAANTDMTPDSLEKEIKRLQGHNDVKQYIICANEVGVFCRNPGVHVVPAYDMLLRDGIQGRIQTIKKYLTQYKNNKGKEEFYTSEYMLLCSFQKLVLRYGEKAERENKKSRVCKKI